MVVRSKIRSFCDAVAKQFRPRKIILFGSRAYGKPTDDSDVDLLVVMNRTRHRGERMARGDSFTQEIFSKGKVLYEASGS